jgi:hypothetical protein
MIALLAILVAAPALAQPGHVFLAGFDGDTIRADRNDWGKVDPVNLTGFRLTAPGEGCPLNPSGRALDAGFTPDTRKGQLSFALPADADLRQGTFEMWFKPAWGSGERALHALFHLKLRGGPYNSLWLGYHGTIGPTSEAYGGNIMDGLDHPAYVDGKLLKWQPGQWHHVALVWTDHSEWVFVDGKLVAQYLSQQPFRIKTNEGKLCLGSVFDGPNTTAGGLIDDVRFTDVPLYSPDQPPVITQPPTADLGVGLGTTWLGAKATADSFTPDQSLVTDIPELHDGKYGNAVPIGTVADQAEVQVDLPAEAEVKGVEWSRDGVPYAGPQGRGWAAVMPYPLAFAIDVSLDGAKWEEVYHTDAFDLSPGFVATHDALRFREDFDPRRCRHVRMRMLRAPRGDPPIMLDEFAVYAPDGRNLALLPGARAETRLVAMVRRHDPSLAIDGRWGEESAWQSATPGHGILTVELPAAAQVSKVVFSRSHEGLATDGIPSAGIIEVSPDGQSWQKIGGITGADPKPRTVTFTARTARFVRLTITSTADGKEPVIDDLRVY